MKISFITFGCKVNTSENELISGELAALGFCVSAPAEADVIVINTCAVTEVAAKKCASYISSLRKKRPDVRIIATGCLTGIQGTNLKALGADAVITNGSKSSLKEHIISLTDGLIPIQNAPFYGGGALNSTSKTRAFFKIQDGCDAFCSYCIIPSLRGSPRSKPYEEAVADFRALVHKGFKEIVLVGIHIGMYGRGTPYNLSDLLEAVTEIPGDFRVRLSSIETNEITDKLISLMAERSEKICPHLHIPLQSGSDKILKTMGRRYLSADYIKAALNAKNRIRGLTIGSDVIVGFPGETESDFNDTVKTLKAADATFIHVFPYSKREGTRAAEMQDHLSDAEKEERASGLRNIWADILLASMHEMKGKVCRVLSERGNKGRSANYMPVVFSGDVLPNNFINVLITGEKNGFLTGEIV